MQTHVTIEGLDLIDLLKFMDDKKNKFLAIMLLDIDDVLLKEHPEVHKKIRKIVLDGVNDYNRSVVRTLFGEIE